MKNIQITFNRFMDKLKPVKVFAFSIAILAGMFMVSCSSPAEKVEKSGDDVTEAKEDLRKAKVEHQADIELFRKETARKTAENDERIDEINVKIENSAKEDRKEYEEKIVLLEHQNESLKVRAKNYESRNNDDDDWETFKSEFNHDMDELGKSLKSFTVDNKK